MEELPLLLYFLFDMIHIRGEMSADRGMSLVERQDLIT